MKNYILIVEDDNEINSMLKDLLEQNNYEVRQAFIRIIENLIKNALVHGTGDYSLSLDNLEDNLVISVSNRTDSIEYKEIDRIFDRFYTTDQSRSRKTTGLGLVIVERFSEQMGGSAEATLEDDIFMVEVKLPLIKKK